MNRSARVAHERHKRSAGRSPLQGSPPRELHRRDESNTAPPISRHVDPEQLSRVVIPTLEEVASRLTPHALASVNGQVHPGEVIAIYVRAGVPERAKGRAIICGPHRTHQYPPRTIDEHWRFYCSVRVLEESAEAMPMEVPC